MPISRAHNGDDNCRVFTQLQLIILIIIQYTAFLRPINKLIPLKSITILGYFFFFFPWLKMQHKNLINTCFDVAVQNLPSVSNIWAYKKRSIIQESCEWITCSIGLTPPHLRCRGGNYVSSAQLAIKQQESGMQDTYACSINMANSDIAVTKSLSQKVFWYNTMSG